MYIVNQTRSEITNTGNIAYINVDGDTICAYTVNGVRRVLGNYDDAPGIFDQMLKDFSSDNSIYNMPE